MSNQLGTAKEQLSENPLNSERIGKKKEYDKF